MTTEATQDSDFPTVPVPPTAAPSFTLEGDCVALLCQQQVLLSKVSDGGGVCSFDNLDLSKRMLLSYLDFCNAHIDDDTLCGTSRMLSHLYEQICDIEQRLTTRSWRPLRRLFGASQDDDLELNAKYQELGKEFARLHAKIFAYCVATTQAPQHVKEEFIETLEAFLAELQSKW